MTIYFHRKLRLSFIVYLFTILSCGSDMGASLESFFGAPELIVEPDPRTAIFDQVQIGIPQKKSFQLSSNSSPGNWDVVVKKVELIDNGDGSFSVTSVPKSPFVLSGYENKKEMIVQFLPKRLGIFKGAIIITWDSKINDAMPWDAKEGFALKKDQKTHIYLSHKVTR